MNKLLLTLFTLCIMACSTNQQSTFTFSAQPQPLMDEKIEAAVNELYERMTPEERLAQLHGSYIFNDLFLEDGRLDTAKCRKEIGKGVGHFSQYAFGSNLEPNELRDRVARLQEWIIENTPNHIPALFHDEAITGVNSLGETIYPQQIGLACSFNTELAELKAQQTSKQMRAIGGLLALSPMVDVCRQPSFNRLEESYGEDGYLSAAMGAAFVRGIQGKRLSEGVAACSKHYLGYGGGGDAPEKELMEEILFPHEAMIRTAGSKVVMPGYHLFHGTKCIANKELLTDILRQYIGFDGVVVSDYTAMSQIREGQTPMHNAAQSINAGADVEFPNDVNFSHLPEAVDSGLVKSEVFETAVKRVLALKYRLGMFDDKAFLYEKAPIKTDTPEERQTAHDLAAQSIVLLKNDGTLPLTSQSSKIALVGPNANSVWAMLGDYTYPCMSYFWKDVPYKKENVHIVTLKEGLEKMLPEGMTMTYERGCDWTEGIETTIRLGGDDRARAYFANRRIETGEEINPERALQVAKESDVIIAAMGEQVLLDGENRVRKNVRLPGRQEEFVRQLVATGKPVVLVMFGGRCQVIGDLADQCAAIIQAWYPGEEGGNAVAEILTGKINPSGKLSVGYPNEETTESLCYVYNTEQDARIKYPFGFGLSYTTFEYADLEVDQQVPTSDEAIHLSFKVKNTGKMAGDEIVQIYVSPDDSPFLSPLKLQGFGRVSLQPGEEKSLSFILSPQQLGYYAEGQWNIRPGRFSIKIGASSQDLRLQQSVNLTGGLQSMPLRTVYFAEEVQ